MSLETDKEIFLGRLLDHGVLDPEGVHHEFNQGLHGRKFDFGKIPEDSPLFDEWVGLTAAFIEREYDQLPDAITGVANGTNKHAEAVAQELGGGVIFLATEKKERSKPVLTEESKFLIEKFEPVFALVDDDVGSAGTNTLSAATSATEAGVPEVEVLYTIQRSETLRLLDEAGIAYRSIIKHVLDNFTPEECRERGFCSQGWGLIPYGQ